MDYSVFQSRLLIGEQAAKRFARYHEMLLEYNTRMDLTAVTDADEMLDRHYVDSLSVLNIENALPKGAKLIDVGTGAGFPGLPLAIAREDIHVVLLDALKKRVGFLNDVILDLNLKNVQAVHLRAEDAARLPLYREQFDIGMARAVAALPTLLEYVLPFVKIGGQALLWKGPSVLNELNDGRKVAKILGGTLVEPIPTPISGRDWQHFIVPIQKSFPTLRQYPRKSGTPSKQPLHQKP
jgi:16S rRNA (guanine(527)-N(7))-methyltransferase GidB